MLFFLEPSLLLQYSTIFKIENVKFSLDQCLLSRIHRHDIGNKSNFILNFINFTDISMEILLLFPNVGMHYTTLYLQSVHCFDVRPPVSNQTGFVPEPRDSIQTGTLGRKQGSPILTSSCISIHNIQNICYKDQQALYSSRMSV